MVREGNDGTHRPVGSGYGRAPLGRLGRSRTATAGSRADCAGGIGRRAPVWRRLPDCLAFLSSRNALPSGQERARRTAGSAGRMCRTSSSRRASRSWYRSPAMGRSAFAGSTRRTRRRSSRPRRALRARVPGAYRGRTSGAAADQAAWQLARRTGTRRGPNSVSNGAVTSPSARPAARESPRAESRRLQPAACASA